MVWYGVVWCGMVWYGIDRKDYPEMAKEAGLAALADAHISFSDIQQAVCGYVYGERSKGDHICSRKSASKR